MIRLFLTTVLASVLPSVFVVGDYDCLCNYNVEKAVFSSANENGQPYGYLYEFDCKPVMTVQDAGDNWYKIQFEQQVGFIKMDQQVRMQVCPGQPPAMDLIPVTTKASIITTMLKTTTTSTTTTTTTPTTTTTTTTPSTTTTTPTTTTTTPTTTTTTPTTTTTTSTTTTTTPTTTTTTPTTTATTPTTTTTTPTTTTTTPTTTTTTTTSTTTTPTTTTTTPTTTTTTPTTTTTTPKPTTTMFKYYGSYWNTEANVTGTAYQYVGVSYNLLTGYPNTVPDPGLLTKQRIFELTGNSSSVREATYVKQSRCTQDRKPMLIYGSKAYQNELKEYIKPSPDHNAHVAESAFTFNSKFHTLRKSLDSITGNNVYLHSITTCKYGTVRYNMDNAAAGHFTVTKEFAKDICSLPIDFNSLSNPKYMQFLDKWGTSIVTSVDMGTKTIDSYQTTPVKVYQHIQRTDNDLVEQGGKYLNFTSSVVINTHDYTHSKASNASAVSGTFGSPHHASVGSSTHQVPIAAELVSIVDALDPKYWNSIIDELVDEGVCSSAIKTIGVGKYGFNIKIALNQYPGYKDASTNHVTTDPPLLDRHTLHVPTTWPFGTYGLMKATSGCPADNVYWQEGFRKQDTEDLNPKNSYSPGIQHYLSGEFHSADILTRFCMKTSYHSMTGGQYDQTWPKGSYCVLKKGSCPSGFSIGYIFWDDEDLHNKNAKGGALPEGQFDSNTKIYYCCRNDGSPSTQIVLPTDRPFVLIRYKGTCQAVNGMTVRDLFVQWDDEDLNNHDRYYGAHPMDDGGSKNHRLHFCYYETPSAQGAVLVG